MRTIGVVTVARSDYGVYLPILEQIQASSRLKLHLIVAGMHLSPEFGLTADAISADGFEIGSRVEMLLSSDTPDGISKSIGLGAIGFAQVYAQVQPDILIVLGDRFEMHAAALSALPFKIPVAHIHGGEITQGSIDDALRHSITKLSHLHFVSTAVYARRVIQLGEESWRVSVSGAPALDNLRRIDLFTRHELATRSNLELGEDPFLLVTFHPVTLEYKHTEKHIQELLSALERVNCKIVFTYPNADTNSRSIIDGIEKFVAKHKRAHAVVNLGTTAYFSLMNQAVMMVGNSSSGIIEAASFELPVVNVGSRQRGRICGKNVIHVGYTRDEILAGIEKAKSPEFRSSLSDLVNPYGDGHAAERIVHRLESVELNDNLLIKRFHDIPISFQTAIE